MKIFTHLNDIDKIPNVKMALGAFDGIHLGHQKIIACVVGAAKRDLGVSVVFTFSNHPLSVIDAKRCPSQIISNEEKTELLAELGVDILCNVPFTKQLSNMSAAEFISLLRQKFQLTHVVVGDNYRYGHKGQGTAATLEKAGEAFGFLVETMNLVAINDPLTQEKMFVSSSAVRELIKEGKVSEAAFLLGRFFSITGKVIAGDRRGRVLGYPTANISLTPGLIVPADGVYAATVSVGRAEYGGVVNIGKNPTFTCRERRLEAHIPDFSGDLYGENLTIRFLERIRPEMAFIGPEQLKLQIAADVQEAQSKLKTLRDKLPSAINA